MYSDLSINWHLKVCNILDWSERSFTDCGLTNSLGSFCWPERSLVDCGLRDILDVSVGG